MASIISASTTSGTALNMSADTTGILQLATGATPTTALTIDTSQNVGIGTSSPLGTLGIAGSATATIVIPRSSNGTTASPVETQLIASTFTNGTYGAGIFALNSFNDTSANFLTFKTTATGNGSPAERMRIDSSGNVLIGTTSTFGAGSFCYQFSGASFDGFAINDTKSNAGTDVSIKFLRNSTAVGSIQTTLTNTSYVTSSDYRLKENVQPMVNALNTIAQLKPVTYKWIADGSDGQGFIAHELQKIVPDCVTGEKDAVDADGNPQYQGIDTSFLVATLTAAIQEQQIIINDLKARIETLEAK